MKNTRIPSRARARTQLNALSVQRGNTARKGRRKTVIDREALPLLLTLSSGVQGFTTIHAGSARQALTRLRFISQLSDTSSELPLTALNTLVSEAIDVVVHVDRTSDGPIVTEITAVEEPLGGADAHHFTTTTLFERRGRNTELTWTGQVSARLAQRFERADDDLALVLGTQPLVAQP